MTCPITLWKQLTTKANALFEAGNLHTALEGYECARSLALTHFSAWHRPDDAVAAVVVSFLNLAEALARIGLVNQASRSLHTVHGSLLKTAADTHLAPLLREAAQRHLAQTHAAVARFERTYGASLHSGPGQNGCHGCADCGPAAPDLLSHLPTGLPIHAVLPAPALSQ